MERKKTSGRCGLASASRTAATLSAGILMTVCQHAAQAALVDPFNVRPVAVAAISADGVHTDLQSILDSMYPPGTMDRIDDQKSDGMWRIGNSPFAFPVLNFEYAGNAGFNVFGIWSGTDTASITRVDLFRGAAGAGGWAMLTWNDNDELVVQGSQTGVYNGVYAGIDADMFGFYLRDSFGRVHYTVDQLNPGGIAQVLAYNLGGAPLWTLAFEDTGSSDRDFNDMVVTMAGISSIPELNAVPLPAAGWLFACGAAGLFGFASRRMGQKHG